MKVAAVKFTVLLPRRTRPSSRTRRPRRAGSGSGSAALDPQSQAKAVLHEHRDRVAAADTPGRKPSGEAHHALELGVRAPLLRLELERDPPGVQASGASKLSPGGIRRAAARATASCASVTGRPRRSGNAYRIGRSRPPSRFGQPIRGAARTVQVLFHLHSG
jgi:hypothetical protein